MTRTRTTRILAGLASLTLVAAACGDDDDAADTTDAAGQADTVADTTADEPVDTAMDDEAMDEMDEESTDDTAMDEDAMDEDAMDEDAMDGGPFGPACGAVPDDGEGSFEGMTDDPAAVAASNNPLLSTLVEAVTQAGLVDTLSSDGPFTIFAPTNDAFMQIPPEDLEAVLADQELLTSILTYHVVAGDDLDAAELGEAGVAATVNGAELEFGADGTTVNGVDVLCSDVTTANATVHIIGEVLMPPADGQMDDGSMDEGAMDESANEVAMPTGPLCEAVPADGEGSFEGMTDDPAATAASNNPVLSTLVTAVTEAGLVDTLNGDGPFTIFAPANPAFEAIPADQLDAVLADVDLLTSILTLHVVAGEQLSSADLAGIDSVQTVNGAEITLATDADGSLSVNGQATVGCADIQTANATVHVIDAVLMP